MKKILILSLIFVVLLTSGCTFSADHDPLVQSLPNTDEILTLEEDDMYDTLIMRFMYANPSELNQKQLTVATLITFDAEMMNGGLCQFFTNDYDGYAQYVSDSLGEIGATQMQALYDDFINQNEIDVTKMGSFRIRSILGYMKQQEQFPYDAFNDAFSETYEQENMWELLLSYVQLHKDEILIETPIS